MRMVTNVAEGINSVLLAFSGGIDSCASVGILRNAGYHVEALTIDMLGDEEMIAKARERADAMQLTLHVVDAREEFRREIINNFTSEYFAGRTPAPCTRCNVAIKWSILAKEADRLGIRYLATGHYFRIKEQGGAYYVSRAADSRKDQSYYLWGVEQSILARTITPMGDAIKEVIKAQGPARSESMGVCFLSKQPYADFLVGECGEMSHGDIVDRSGAVVGRHNGIARYTIGQRRGEGIPSGVRVVEISAAENRVVVGDNSELFHHTLHLTRCRFVSLDELSSADDLTVMVRGLGLNPEGYAQIEVSADGCEATIRLSNPAWAPAPGQPIVVYRGDRVVGGGYLTHSAR